MPARRSLTISLSPELPAVAQRLLRSGRYGNLSDVMRAALRLLDEGELAFQTRQSVGASQTSDADRPLSA